MSGIQANQFQGINPVGRFAADAGAKPASSAAKTVGRVMGIQGDSLSLGQLLHSPDAQKALLKDAKIGAISNVPFDLYMFSQDYRKGKLKANQYVAQTISDSVGFGAWTIGGALAAAALAPIGLPALAVGIAGFAVGMTCQTLFQHFLGNKFAKKLASVIPEKDVKPFADFVTKHIMNPLHDHVFGPLWNAIKGHKALSIGAAGLLAVKFPGFRNMAATMAGGTAAGVVTGMGLSKVIGPTNGPFDQAGSQGGVAIDPKWVAAYNTVVQKFEGQGANPQQAASAAESYFVKTMMQNGASQKDAEQLVAAIAQQAAAPQTPAPSPQSAALPPGMLMGR